MACRPANLGPRLEQQLVEVLIASLMADNAAHFARGLTEYLAERLAISVGVLEDVPWQERERRLLHGEAHVGVVCGLQYVYAVDRDVQPGVELLCAPVMRAPRYQHRPIYFSEVVVRRDNSARSLLDLRKKSFAYNEPTSHSGYNLARYALALHGETNGFFANVVQSGTHQQSLQLILDGRVDAAAIDTTVLEQEVRLTPELRKHIRIVETLGPSPIPPLVVSRTVPPELRKPLREALLAMHTDPLGVQVLESAHMARLVPVVDADYDPIRRMAAEAAAVQSAW